jgi:hypothetical protein
LRVLAILKYRINDGMAYIYIYYILKTRPHIS